mmetsp:Transcript_4181/g.6408  ORF Transcript_4181/g.6408 Transcript_4181/m.6408 type:complete len:139 (-) Transcript_4181:2893-3309(-)
MLATRTSASDITPKPSVDSNEEGEVLDNRAITGARSSGVDDADDSKLAVSVPPPSSRDRSRRDNNKNSNRGYTNITKFGKANVGVYIPPARLKAMELEREKKNSSRVSYSRTNNTTMRRDNDRAGNCSRRLYMVQSTV